MARRLFAFAVVGLISTGLFISSASARLLIKDVTNCFLDGVAANGTSLSAQGNFGKGKVYKYTGSGILVLVCTAKVTNLSGRVAVFVNEGCTIQDPQTNVFVSATSDVEVVGPRKGALKANAALVCVYNPALAPPPPEENT